MLTIKEKLSYGLGDAAGNIIFQVTLNFMVFFYTDVFGLTAAAVGTLMLVVRFFDAFTDPLVGVLSDRTKTKHGQYRPYLLYTSIPFGILAFLAFYTPDLSENNKLIYAYITYAGLMALFTLINIPYSALGGMLSDDPSERASIQSYRFGCGMIGGAIVSASLMPIVAYFGKESQALGFQYAMGIMASISVICFLLCFYYTRERTQEGKKTNNADIKKDVTILIKNSQYKLIILSAFFLLIMTAMRGSVTPFYVKNYLNGEEGLISIFITSGLAFSFLGAVSTHFLTKKNDKTDVFKISLMCVAILQVLAYLIPGKHILFNFFVTGLSQFSQMIAVTIMFSMIPDSSDYGAKNNGRKVLGLSYSAHLLSIKLGIAVGGAFTGWALSYFGYVSSEKQDYRSIEGILLLFTLIPALFTLGSLYVMSHYKLNKKLMKKLKPV